MGKFDGKVVIITGGCSGIGKATAILFAQEGAKLVIADVNDSIVGETFFAIKDIAGTAIFVKTDVSKSAEVKNLVAAAVEEFGQLDIYFNNAGIMPPVAPITDVSEETWDKVMSVNIKGIFLGMKYCIPQMLSRGGSIVNMASNVGFVGFPYESAYGASKAAIIEMTKTAALEYAKHNIRVNCICPGLVKTPLSDNVWSRPEAQPIKQLLSPSAMNRSAIPEEIAHSVLFLADNESASFITGSALVVDGGMIAL